MTLSKEQILALRDAATKGPWLIKENTGKDEAWCDWHEVGPFDLMGGEMNDDDRFLAALPEIAQTAIDALERVEELEKELKQYKPEPMKCDTCGATTPDVSFRPDSYANDVGNDPTAMHTACDKCDYENKMDI